MRRYQSSPGPGPRFCRGYQPQICDICDEGCRNSRSKVEGLAQDRDPGRFASLRKSMYVTIEFGHFSLIWKQPQDLNKEVYLGRSTVGFKRCLVKRGPWILELGWVSRFAKKRTNSLSTSIACRVYWSVVPLAARCSSLCLSQLLYGQLPKTKPISVTLAPESLLALSLRRACEGAEFRVVASRCKHFGTVDHADWRPLRCHLEAATMLWMPLYCLELSEISSSKRTRACLQ